MRNKMPAAALLAAALAAVLGCTATVKVRPVKEDPPPAAKGVKNFYEAFAPAAFNLLPAQSISGDQLWQNDPLLYLSTYIMRIDYRGLPYFNSVRDRFHYTMKLVYPDYEKNTTTVTTKTETIRTITFPKDRCGAKIVFVMRKGERFYDHIDFTIQRDAEGTCEKEYEIAKSLEESQRELKRKNLFPENQPLCKNVPKAKRRVTIDGYESPKGWEIYSSGYCYQSDGRLIHYAWQTKKQQEENRIQVQKTLAGQRAYNAYRARKLAEDPLFDFTMQGPDGRLHRCGRDSKDEAVRCSD
jgi:hypothetical protein